MVANFEMLEGGRKNKKQTAPQNRGGDDRGAIEALKAVLETISAQYEPRFVSEVRFGHSTELTTGPSAGNYCYST